MELVKVQVARSVWLFDTQDLNPRGVTLYDIFGRFAAKFQFAMWPKPEECLLFNTARGSLYFRQGKFMYGGKSIDVDFEIHNDGIVANTRNSTEASEGFLQEFLAWSIEHLEVAPNIPRRKVCKSELIVQGSPRLESLSSRLETFAEALSDMFGQHVLPSGVIFGSAQTTGVLTLERRANTALEDNQYFSISALHTSKHMEALDAFERIASA